MNYVYDVGSPVIVAGDRMTKNELKTRGAAFAAELQRLWQTGTDDNRALASSLAARSLWRGTGFLFGASASDVPEIVIVKAARRWWNDELWRRACAEGVAAMRQW